MQMHTRRISHLDSTPYKKNKQEHVRHDLKFRWEICLQKTRTEWSIKLF
jgi:hypothetical protein